MSLKGCIFAIARGSMHDGPGVRTVAYFKGCDLRCAWCHNPEGMDARPELLVDERRCIACGRCAALCSCHSRDALGRHIHIREGCAMCGKCVDACPSGAIERCGEWYDTGALVRELMRDVHYFRRSGGGVTFSGGECLLQAGFLREVCAACQALGVHTLVETALHVPWPAVEVVAPFVDEFYVDIKHMNAGLHRRYTGADNAPVLDNLRRLSAVHRRITARVPLIPGVNDGFDDLLCTCRFAGSLDLAGVELLRYNPLGESKYRCLGRPFQNFGQGPQALEDVLALCRRLNAALGREGFVRCRA